ncbi:MAG: hypothetical protein ACE361_00730 [Aureliella sp.]
MSRNTARDFNQTLARKQLCRARWMQGQRSAKILGFDSHKEFQYEAMYF